MTATDPEGPVYHFAPRFAHMIEVGKTYATDRTGAHLFIVASEDTPLHDLVGGRKRLRYRCFPKTGVKCQQWGYMTFLPDDVVYLATPYTRI